MNNSKNMKSKPLTPYFIRLVAAKVYLILYKLFHYFPFIFTYLKFKKLSDNSIQSLSCMYVIEYIGLGHYDDPMDYDGDIKAISELKQVCAAGGNMLFVEPIGGRPNIKYNSHRIYSYDQVMELFKNFKLMNFLLITDSGNFISNCTQEIFDQHSNGCGYFWFEKDKK
ncbi:MAG: DUF268 domain-containing protein [Candidatus Kapabacteria bacterium]|nr:DUF268 domain-containing protein [Candidatus Kapabacteria bacterium]